MKQIVKPLAIILILTSVIALSTRANEKNYVAAKHAEFTKDFDATLPSLYDEMTVSYMEVYTKEDIKAMIAFYESPVGQKITAKSADLSAKTPCYTCKRLLLIMLTICKDWVVKRPVCMYNAIIGLALRW